MNREEFIQSLLLDDVSYHSLMNLKANQLKDYIKQIQVYIMSKRGNSSIASYKEEVKGWYPLSTGTKSMLVLRIRKWILKEKLIQLRYEIQENNPRVSSPSFQTDIETCIDLYNENLGRLRLSLLKEAVAAANWRALQVISISLQQFSRSSPKGTSFSPLDFFTLRSIPHILVPGHRISAEVAQIRDKTTRIYLQMCLNWEGNVNPSQSPVFRTLLKQIRLWSQSARNPSGTGGWRHYHLCVFRLVRIYLSLVPAALNAFYSGDISFSLEEIRNWRVLGGRAVQYTCANSLLHVSIQTSHLDLIDYLFQRMQPGGARASYLTFEWFFLSYLAGNPNYRQQFFEYMRTLLLSDEKTLWRSLPQDEIIRRIQKRYVTLDYFPTRPTVSSDSINQLNTRLQGILTPYMGLFVRKSILDVLNL